MAQKKPINVISQGFAAADGFMSGFGSKAIAALSGAATLNKSSGKVTSEALTTAGLAAYTLTITNAKVAATDIAFASVCNGTNTQGTPAILSVKCTAGTIVIVVGNLHATQALNGTLVISFLMLANGG